MYLSFQCVYDNAILCIRVRFVSRVLEIFYSSQPHHAYVYLCAVCVYGMYAGTYVCVYVNDCVRLHVRICARVCLYVMFVGMCLCTYVYMYVYVCVSMCMYIHICMRTHIYTPYGTCTSSLFQARILR